MSYKIIFSNHFNNTIKYLIKKYPSLKNDILSLISSLKINPIQGIALGKNMYIIRLSIGSKGKGKSGGARVLTLVKVEEMTVLLFAIYDKSIKDTLSTKEIQELINNT